ncbi:LPS assembly lipoprotein LptE [Ancylobacter pratisalsi]|uniref:LPS-assembly lipoprotein n=1 Tax=Ancylobacter pratisalsi TaxID=1745854 RepID=A0A6P1YL46_9HYPH|nr:LPS assembly lipoprotein LptE [Ancylobacter pratisalsi]QIB34039.1 hypothetical protein G3A50_10180 [Ancylobacter pratisalsi]
MSSFEPPHRIHRQSSRRRLLGLAAVGLLALSTAGCFQPMYAQKNPVSGATMQEQLENIQVVFVGGRLGNEVRNDLIFALTGGAGNPTAAAYRLELTVNTSTTASIVDSVSGLPEVELVSVDVSWRLFDAADPKKQLIGASAFGKASIDSGYQRFARERAIRDAQNRASQVAADSIKGQLASFFALAPEVAASVTTPAPAAPAPKS